MTLMKALVRSDRLLVGGHRGQQLAGVRENTLAAFETLLGKGIPYVEVDVQLTKDGVLVLYHDHELSLQTALSGLIRDYDLTDLRQSFDICTVEEAIDWAKSKGMGLAFELKLTYPAMLADRDRIGQGLVSLIEAKDFVDWCFVFGKDLDLLAEMKTALPDLTLGLIALEPPADPVAFMEAYQGRIYLNFLSQLSLDLVASLQAAGYLVDGSLVNDKEDLDLALALGVNLIESDNPELILTYLEEKTR